MLCIHILVPIVNVCEVFKLEIRGKKMEVGVNIFS